MRLPIFLDTDPGIDDAVAIAAAIFAPELDLQLMTTVAGNVSVEKTTRNALQLLHFWNAEIPLAQGAAVPLVRAPRDAASVHGESGMAGYDFVEHNRKPLGIPAFLAIRDTGVSGDSGCPDACTRARYPGGHRPVNQYCAVTFTMPGM
ncbi:inosine-uridine preferring nucleoside hydrolase family protein [Escherichia coli DEC4E]|nr:inosine-uridine preferring nucleoside hydrolase family protein [Escherichia coli DEC4E]